MSAPSPGGLPSSGVVTAGRGRAAEGRRPRPRRRVSPAAFSGVLPRPRREGISTQPPRLLLPSRASHPRTAKSSAGLCVWPAPAGVGGRPRRTLCTAPERPPRPLPRTTTSSPSRCRPGLRPRRRLSSSRRPSGLPGPAPSIRPAALPHRALCGCLRGLFRLDHLFALSFHVDERRFPHRGVLVARWRRSLSVLSSRLPSSRHHCTTLPLLPNIAAHYIERILTRPNDFASSRSGLLISSAALW